MLRLVAYLAMFLASAFVLNRLGFGEFGAGIALSLVTLIIVVGEYLNHKDK